MAITIPLTPGGDAGADISRCLANNPGEDHFILPRGEFRWTTSVAITRRVRFTGTRVGEEIHEGGTWLLGFVDDPDAPPVSLFSISGTAARGSVFEDFGIYQGLSQLYPGPARWLPNGWQTRNTTTDVTTAIAQMNAAPWVFTVSTLGRVDFDNLHFVICARAIRTCNSGRLNVGKLTGCFYRNAISIEQARDVSYIGTIHDWTYSFCSTGLPAGWIKGKAQGSSVLSLARSDGLFCQGIFAFNAFAGVQLLDEGSGTTTNASIDNLYADFCHHGIVGGSIRGAELSIRRMTFHGEDYSLSLPGQPAVELQNSHAIALYNSDTQGNIIRVEHARVQRCGGAAVLLGGSNNRLLLGHFHALSWNTHASYVQALFETGTGNGNQVLVSDPLIDDLAGRPHPASSNLFAAETRAGF